ncbi:MAG TPA: hypothetical protein VFQ45_18820 [Longimicrobium sp.]|nr:hypothetical protein [Longimicrobium sp.]
MPKPDIAPEPTQELDAALAAVDDAAARFAEVKSEVLHRLAAVDEALLSIVQRVYDATPPEYQRRFVVRTDGEEEDLPLPDFFRLLMERAGGTEGEFTILVTDDLYDEE